MSSGIINSGPKLGDFCSACGTELTNFTVKVKAGHVQKKCKTCWKKHHESLPSRTKKARKAQYVQWKFGISIEEYNKKLEIQLHGCAICKQPCNTGRQLAIDHNHQTNQIRDLLCYRCNTVLGLINEDEDLLIEIIEYLKRHSTEVAI